MKNTKKPFKLQQNIIILFAVFVLAGIFSIFNSNFLDKYNLLSMTQSLAPYAIMSLGVTFVIATGGIDLSGTSLPIPRRSPTPMTAS